MRLNEVQGDERLVQGAAVIIRMRNIGTRLAQTLFSISLLFLHQADSEITSYAILLGWSGKTGKHQYLTKYQVQYDMGIVSLLTS
jgi:hypothetical protein